MTLGLRTASAADQHSAQQFWQPHSSHILPLFLSTSSIKHQAEQRSTAGHLHCLTPRQQGKQAFYGRLVKPEFSHNSSKSDVNPLRRNPKKLFKHFLILVHFVRMIDKDDLNFCWWDVGRHTVYQSLLARPLSMLHVLSTLNTSN